MLPHTINIYSGGSYNEIHDCENVYLTCEKADVHVDKTPIIDAAPNATSLPDILLTDEARELHARLVEAGMVDEAWMPVGLSNAEKGTLIDYIAERLDIRAKWKLFGALWHTDPETLRTAKARGLEQEKTWAFRTRLDAL